ncbi:hypothetical protein [Actinoplanes sp. NPDC049681]|uniref:hypothetical protein n=1 Tax=Actinoplanes sp. NPDC049681 TaxID=3363905 RepID=UPI0037A08B23
MNQWELHYDRDGTLTTPAETTFLDDLAARGITDLFVFSHGWGTGERRARNLYDSLFPLIAALAPPTAGFAGIFWPSLWFPDPPAEATAQVRAAVEADRPGAADAVVAGKEVAQTLLASFEPARQAAVTRMGELVDEGTAGVGTDTPAVQQARLEEFHSLLGTVFAASHLEPEDAGGRSLLLADDPRAAYARIADILGSAPPDGDAQGLGDLFGKVWRGAKDALRVGSYFEMKARAGDVGRRGLGPMLARLHQRLPQVRVHLAGHSFGARLVSFALAGIGPAEQSPVASLCLVQGAFSHYAFTPLSGMPFGNAGALHAVADRVRGPLTATFSPHDWAVGRWYPKASFLARDDAAADVDPAMQWGGMGAHGFQGAIPARELTLLPPGSPYGLTAGTFHAVDASQVIADTRQSAFAGAHSDIVHPEVAWLIAAAT